MLRAWVNANGFLHLLTCVFVFFFVLMDVPHCIEKG